MSLNYSIPVSDLLHVLIAINMVQAHAKCQDNPAGPSSSICPKRKGLERPLYCLLMAFCAAGVRGLMLGSNNWRKYFGNTWHRKVDDSRKQHLSLPTKALVNAELS
ncbi:hypothetical protein BY996DRAFT_6416398 [Phakopsora pachyrhizi]|nr:hypothetical protein BY996DRAFT_6416398 [Phakopsora pachyrhizi]